MLYQIKTPSFLAAITLLFIFISTTTYAVQLPDFTQIVNTSGKGVVNVITLNKDSKKMVPDNVREDLEGTPLMDVLKQMFGDKLEENLSGKGPGLGSGTIISADGYIVTNLHVIDGADTIYVRLNDKREFPAKVIGKDVGTDIALLKIDADNLPFLKYADSNGIKVGEWVLAIGSPYGFENTLTVGVVSATGRSLGTERYVPFIQTDAPINPGNSGGPLLDTNGDVIGINSQIITESGSYAGLSFAVPSNVVKTVVEQLQKTGSVSRGWLGLAFQDLNRDLADSFGLKMVKGALISKVIPNSPADKAGIKEGDIITEFNGTDIVKATDLPPIVGMLPIDSKVPMKLIRSKKELDVSVVLSKFNEDDNSMIDIRKKNLKLPSFDKLQQDITVRELEAFEKADMASDKKGVMVQDVRGDSWINGGLRRGDFIRSINGKPITNVKEFYDAVHSAKSDHAISMLISRQGDVQRFLAVKLDR